MPIIYPPKRGQILICDFTGLLAHEMSKVRPVIVLSPRIAHRFDICTVVPLSTTQPKWIENYHYELQLAVPLPPPFDKPTMWVKGDMVYSLNINRMDKPYVRTTVGKRNYLEYMISQKDMKAIELCVMNGLGIHIDK